MRTKHVTRARQIPLTLAEIAEAQARSRRGEFVDDIAEALSTTIEAVNEALSGRVAPPLPCAEAPRRLSLKPHEIAEAGRLANVGVSIPEIAAAMNISIPRADWAVAQARRAATLAARMRGAARDRALSDEIERRELADAPETEPTIRDLMRVPLPKRQDS